PGGAAAGGGVRRPGLPLLPGALRPGAAVSTSDLTGASPQRTSDATGASPGRADQSPATVLTTRTRDGRRGVELNPNRGGGSTGASGPRSTPSQVASEAV